MDLEQIAAAAEAVDGAAPVDEATWRLLRHHPERVRVWHEPDAFALLAGQDLSLVVAPTARGRGVGAALLDQALAGHSGPLRAWSHADHPGAAALADATGFVRAGELWVLRRQREELPALVVPDGVELRAYRPEDQAELLRVNAAAFAGHQEQAAMDADDLAERMAEPWFSAQGLLVAMSGQQMLGFHWTKQRSPDVGEVYVLAVDPQAQGIGLGRALSLAGLHHLAGLGVREWLLFVEADNEAGLATYRSLGFSHRADDTHARYARA